MLGLSLCSVPRREEQKLGEHFDGVTIDGGKRYSQMVERSFHISMAALEPASAKEAISVMIKHENSEFVLCSLNTKSGLQQYLDLNFTEGEEVSFFLSGSGIVHLTGFLLEDEETDDDFVPIEDSDHESNDTDSSDEDTPELIPVSQSKSSKSNDIKRKLEANFNSSNAKKKKGILDDRDDDFMDDKAMEASDDEESDIQEDSEDFSEEEVLSKKKKLTEHSKKSNKQKIQEENKTPKEAKKLSNQKAASGDNKVTLETPSSESTESTKKKRKKKKKKKAGEITENGKPEGTPKGKTIGQKKVVTGGTLTEELKEGHGPEAKAGKMIHVYYTGKLTSGKQFDSCVSGKPFSFKLGRSEVIKGWDSGIAGMKVGGKRIMTVPPQQGYGSQRQGPIPANSTLVFEVELKAVS